VFSSLRGRRLCHRVHRVKGKTTGGGETQQRAGFRGEKQEGVARVETVQKIGYEKTANRTTFPKTVDHVAGKRHCPDSCKEASKGRVLPGLSKRTNKKGEEERRMNKTREGGYVTGTTKIGTDGR